MFPTSATYDGRTRVNPSSVGERARVRELGATERSYPLTPALSPKGRGSQTESAERSSLLRTNFGARSVEFDNSFDVPLPPGEAWPVLMDIPRIAHCMPGA